LKKAEFLLLLLLCVLIGAVPPLCVATPGIVFLNWPLNSIITAYNIWGFILSVIATICLLIFAVCMVLEKLKELMRRW